MRRADIFGAIVTKNVMKESAIQFSLFFVNKKIACHGTMKTDSIPGEYERFAREGVAFVSAFCEMGMRGRQRSLPPGRIAAREFLVAGPYFA